MKKTNEEILESVSGLPFEHIKKYPDCVPLDEYLEAMSQAVKQRDDEIKEWADKMQKRLSNLPQVLTITEELKQYLNQKP